MDGNKMACSQVKKKHGVVSICTVRLIC